MISRGTANIKICICASMLKQLKFFTLRFIKSASGKRKIFKSKTLSRIKPIIIR